MRLYEPQDLPASARAAEIAGRCAKARQTRSGWIACCPAHDDRHPSLSITPDDDRVRLHCFARCTTSAIVAALGLTLTDVFVSRGRFLPAPGSRARVPAVPRPIPDAPERRARLQKVWQQAKRITSGDPVWRYLERRGLLHEPIPPTLRCHPRLEYWDNGIVSYYPALIAAIQGPSNTVVTLHRIYLTPDGQKAPVPTPKKFMRSPSTLRGAAARLDRAAARLVVAEGLETALATRRSTGYATWAALSAGGLETLVLPPVVELLIIAADNDVNDVGQQAARTLAERVMREGRRVKICIPDTPGTDWADGIEEMYGG